MYTKLKIKHLISALAKTTRNHTIYKLTISLLLIGPCNYDMHLCGRAEYDSGDGCCPVCFPGFHVLKHCTEYTSTTCAPCPPSTFSDEPSGLISCLPCRICDYNRGLRVKKPCTSTSDTVCEPLEGHHCIDTIKDGCREALEHKDCSPGQYIKQNGTASSDTDCGVCGNNTYSDGTFTSCRSHTRCEPLGLDIIREGSSSSDAECGKNGITAITILPVVVLAVVVFAVTIVLMRLLWKCFSRRGHTVISFKKCTPKTSDMPTTSVKVIAKP